MAGNRIAGLSVTGQPVLVTGRPRPVLFTEMDRMDHRVELLAPAGNAEGFYGAIHAGADAVYLGGKHFGARANADNFTQEELLACIRYAHILGRRVYLTVNTLVKEKEFGELEEFLLPLYNGGLDGVIVQDIGVLVWIRDRFPGLKLHASTQMTITGKYGAELLKSLGVERVVPARELNLYEIMELKKATGLEVETFIHGAMCYCYSGQCLFSSILGGRSGNRGRCAQPCRLPYRVERDWGTTGEIYPLSLKDLCTIEVLPELLGAGIDSFKIEGRMKKPEYTAGVTSIYRKYIDRYYAAGGVSEGGWEIDREDLVLLGSLYIRSERQDGYYFKQNGREMLTLENPSYGTLEERVAGEIREKFLAKRPGIDISVQARFHVGQPAELSFTAERQGRRVMVSAYGEVVAVAEKQPVTKENIVKQVSRLGDTPFHVADMEVAVDESAFYPLKAINELRRKTVMLLEEALIEANGFCVRREGGYPDEPCREETCCREAEDQRRHPAGKDSAYWHIGVQSRAQFEAVAIYIREWKSREKEPGHIRIYLESELFHNAVEKGDESLTERIRELVSADCEMVLALPYILRGRDEAYLESLWEKYDEHRDLFSGFLVRSLEGLGFVRARCTYDTRGKSAVYGDAGLYIWNRETMEVMGGRENGFQLDGVCLPYELNAGEQHSLVKGAQIPCEKIVYGRIPLMVTANCVVNTVDGCRGREDAELYYLRDRYNKRFPVLRNCRYCMNIIYNCIPLSLHGEIRKWSGQVGLRLNFTVENGEETAAVLQYFLEGPQGMPFYEYTAGHEKRGAE